MSEVTSLLWQLALLSRPFSHPFWCWNLCPSSWDCSFALKIKAQGKARDLITHLRLDQDAVWPSSYGLLPTAAAPGASRTASGTGRGWRYHVGERWFYILGWLTFSSSCCSRIPPSLARVKVERTRRGKLNGGAAFCSNFHLGRMGTGWDTEIETEMSRSILASALI